MIAKLAFPALHGTIDRRMLINFRIRPDVAAGWLPAYFRPKLVNGWAVAGICLIRLKAMRPRGIPAGCGLASENAAHRIAVEWDEKGVLREGVYIPRRDTSSALQAFLGGRFFPGRQHVADFETRETGEEFGLKMRSRDGGAALEVQARRAREIPGTSVFPSLAAASDFFARGSVGYSATQDPGCCDGLELHADGWRVEPLAVQTVRSSYFDNPRQFPAGAIHFDCALLMQNLEHYWRILPRLERNP